MLRIECKRGVLNAKRYFREDFAAEGFDLEPEERIVGTWWGRGAESLGLKGEVRGKDFLALCDNQHPGQGVQLTPRVKANRRVGYDLTFSPPKSVSIAQAVGGDDRLLQAFSFAVRKTLEAIEAVAAARVRTTSTSHDRLTGNLVAALFDHRTTRPVGGVPDPHLHAHCFVFNCTFDDAEQRWKALQFAEAYRLHQSWQALFANTLAESVRDLGFEVRPSPGGSSWELGGTSRSLIDRFSRRTSVIENKARAVQATSPTAKGKLGAKTRERKLKGLKLSALVAEWRSRLSAEELRSLAPPPPPSSGNGEGASSAHCTEPALAEVVEAVSKRLFARSAVVPLGRFVNAVILASPGRFGNREIEAAIVASGALVRESESRTFVTLPEILDRERAVVRRIRAGMGSFKPLCAKPPTLPRAASSLGSIAASRLHAALTSNDQVIALLSHTEAERSMLRDTLLSQSRLGSSKALLLGPTNAARQQLLDEGHAGAVTVAHFLSDPDLQAHVRGGHVVLTHAELVGTDHGSSLLEVVQKHDARLSLIGLRDANRPPLRGSLLDLTLRHGNFATEYAMARVASESPYSRLRDAVAERSGEVPWTALNECGAVRDCEPGTAATQAAREYVERTRRGERVGLVAPTSQEQASVTAAIRSELREAGTLGRERTYRVLVPLSERPRLGELRDATKHSQFIAIPQRAFSVGNVPGMKEKYAANEPWRVRGQDLSGRLIVSSGMAVRAMPWERADACRYFEEKSVKLAAGDQIRLTQNTRAHSLLDLATGHKGRFSEDPRHKLTAGTTYTIRSLLPKGALLLTNGAVLPKSFMHLTHGYVDTPRSAQARPKEHFLMVAQGDSATVVDRGMLRALTAAASKSVTLFTDNARGIESALSRPDVPLSATALEAKPRAVWLEETPLLRPSAEAREQRHLNHTPAKHNVARDLDDRT